MDVPRDSRDGVTRIGSLTLDLLQPLKVRYLSLATISLNFTKTIKLKLRQATTATATYKLVVLAIAPAASSQASTRELLPKRLIRRP